MVIRGGALRLLLAALALSSVHVQVSAFGARDEKLEGESGLPIRMVARVEAR
jgi:hypothetical protein